MKYIEDYYQSIEMMITSKMSHFDHKVNVGLQILRSISVVRQRFKESDKDINQVNLIKLKQLIKKEFWNNIGGQQDAHEFMNTLIDYIQTTFDFFEVDVIQNEFSAKTMGAIIGECKHFSKTETNYDYYELFLQLSDKNKNSIQTLIDNEYYQTTNLTKRPGICLAFTFKSHVSQYHAESSVKLVV
jgi:hypothetical protein